MQYNKEFLTWLALNYDYNAYPHLLSHIYFYIVLFLLFQVEEGDVHSGRHLLANLEESNNINGTLLNITDNGAKAFLFMKTVHVCLKNSQSRKDPKDQCAFKFNMVPDEVTTWQGSQISNNTAR